MTFPRTSASPFAAVVAELPLEPPQVLFPIGVAQDLHRIFSGEIN